MCKRNGRVLTKKQGRLFKQSLSLVLAVALLLCTIPILPGMNWAAAADELSGITEQPVLLVSGTGIIDGAYTADNIGDEQSYTLEELQALEEITQLYSTINTTPTRSVYLGKGISVDTLLQESNVAAEDFGDYEIDMVAADGYTVRFDPALTGPSTTKGKPLKTPAFDVNRYYYPNIQQLVVGMDGETYIYSNEENAAVDGAIAKTILAWERGGERGEPEIVPDTTETLGSDEALLLMVGQQNVWEQTNPLFNKTVNKVLVGGAVTESAITIDGTAKTRSEILLMERADRSYTYETSGGTATDYVRGIPLAVILQAYNDDDIVSFTAADGYTVSASGMTVSELISGNYLLAYEKGTNANDLTGIYATAKSDPSIYGFFTLYGDGEKPSKLINSITVTSASGNDFANSPYKHITNGGLTGQDGPYDIDAITGATLTIEGPGLSSSVPLSILELESQNAGAFRGVYTDNRDGADWELQYEGIKLSHLLNDMSSGDSGINLTADAHKVLIKNRVRQTIAEFTLGEIEEADTAGKPIIVAYGTSTTDDDPDTAPFVYDGAAGYKDALDNDDGPIKLVYDKSAFASDPNPDYTEFSNMAYIYIAEEVSPGFKHNIAPYDTPENSEYVLTVTGDKIGREVNYTVDQLENMVMYDADAKPAADGMGYRDEYSLSNSTYWYVNEYEGVQLWKLLQKSGLASSSATGSEKDTLIQFSATDNYKDFDKFTIEQVSNPDLFGFYEKNPADLNDGNYLGVAEDLKSSGYPVLVAYGVNSYPYVIKNTLDGYMSGLSNDGGPLRIISGKTEYSHANGSKQAKLLDKIIVGEDKYYSTHKYNPNLAGLYQTIASSTLNVKVISGAAEDGAVLKDITYQVGDLEELLYGGTLTAAQLKEAKVKAFYEAYKNGSAYNDLYEGLDLVYFLEQVVQLPGYKGTITFSDGTNTLSKSLEEVLAFSGYNGTTGLGELPPVLAYAKNGAPMVNSKDVEDGYEGTVTLAAGTDYEHTITVKNNGGPLAVMFPLASVDAVSADSLNSVTSITINLSPDNYAHTELPYSTLAENTITISGEGTRLTEAKAFTVADIEGKQTLAVTADYNIKKSADSESQLRYRGIPLYSFLSSTDVGLKPNADQVIVSCSDQTTYTFSLNEVYKSDYINGQNPAINNLKMILAYGSASVDNPDPEDGKPLVQEKTVEAGYDETYGNSGGPIRLVVGQIDTDDINSAKILKDVTGIEVTASDLVSWNHSSSPIYEQYLDYPFQLQVVDSSNNPLIDKAYTIAELEAMTSLVERENITWIGTQEWEGINLWDFVLQEASTISGIGDPTSVTAYASDGFSKELRSIFGMDAIENGINDGGTRIPIILGYAVSGYPLVPGNTSDGYTALADNDGGPLRLMTHGNQGACLSDTIKVVVKIGAGGNDPQPGTELDFNIYGLDSGTVAMDIRTIKNITQGEGGKVVASYNWFGDHDGDSTTDKQATSDMVKGAYLVDLLASAGITGSDIKVDIVTTDGYAPTHYKGLTLDQIQAQGYFVAYDKSTDGGSTWTEFSDIDKNSVAATVRIYRNYDDGSSTWYNRVTNVKGVNVSRPVIFDVYPADGSEGNLPLAGIRSISVDGADGLWVSTYGGGVGYKASGADSFNIYNKASNPALATAVVSAVAVDASGGVWMTQNASYSDPSGNRGVAYMKDGQISYYTESDEPATIPNNYVQEIQTDSQGNIWFGSFGGLTKYNPGTGGWTTWDQTYEDSEGDHFPAQSVDNLIFDGQGGVWLGFYPTGSGTEADPFVGGFAHMSVNGDITSYQYTADYDAAIESSLLAQVWVRDIAVDGDGGAWVVASGSMADLENVGGTIWYVDDQGQATRFTGDQLLGAGRLTGNSELRMVTIDPDGGLWFGSSGDGVFYIADSAAMAPLSITAQYSGSTGSWNNTTLWNNIYSLDFVGSTLYAGSSAGLAYRTFEFDNSGGEEPTIIESFTISGAGTGDIAYYVGGSYDKTFKGLGDGAGKVTSSYPYNGTTHYVKGALLSTLLADAGAGENIEVTILTSDGYSKDSYEKIPYTDLVSQDYFVAYDVGEGTETLSYVADTDDNDVTASYRIYRNYDDGLTGHKDNRIKCVVGVTVSKAGSGGPGPSEDYDLIINGPGVSITTEFTIDGLKNAVGNDKVSTDYYWLNSYGTTGTDSFEGVYLENLLDDVVGLKASARSITITASDGYYRSFNLDSDKLGVYWTDIQGNQIMLAWEKNGTPCDLQLVVGQTDSEHVNKPNWVSDIVEITVNSESTEPGSGSPGGYEGQTVQEEEVLAPLTGIISSAVQADVAVSGSQATAGITIADINEALKAIQEQRTAEGIVEAVIEINALSGSTSGVTSTELVLPADVIKALAQDGNITVVIKTDLGEITLSPEVLKQLAAGNSESVVIRLSLSTDADLNEDARDRIGTRPVVDIQIIKGGQEISSLSGHQIKLAIPYTLSGSENNSQLLAYYINQAGAAVPLTMSKFDEEQGKLLFATTHLSLYGVGYHQISFSDIKNHWSKDSIEFLAARGIINGKGAGIFDPNANVTRAEFVTLLYKLAGATATVVNSAGFADVQSDAWYADAVNWAVTRGIVSGFGNGRFGPNEQITREQMAVMTDNFIKAMKADLDLLNDNRSFTDQNQISSWAATAVSRMQQFGIINGRPDGSFAPQGTASRAEAAAVLRGYIDTSL